MAIKIIQTPDGPRLWDTNRSKLRGSPPSKPRAPKAKTITKPIIRKPFTSSRPVTNFDFTQPVYEPVEIESESIVIAAQKFDAIKENNKVEVIKESINEESKEVKSTKPIISRITRLEVNKLIDVDEEEGAITHRLAPVGDYILSGHALEQPERTWLSVIASGTIDDINFTELGEYSDYEEALHVALVEMQEILAEEEILREYLRDQKFEDKVNPKSKIHALGLHRDEDNSHPEVWFRIPTGEQGEHRYAKISIKDNHTLSIRFEPRFEGINKDGEVDSLNAIRSWLINNS